MNIELRRYGIVIKNIPITGEKASIGSGADCDILIEDPYLAAHVGDLVRRGDSWFITDAGTSLDGITRDGERIDDEAVVDGKVYSISGFELVAHLQAAPQRSPDLHPQRGERGVVPGTIMESIEDLRRPAVIPGTVVESIADLRRKPSEIPKTVFEPLPTRPAPVASPMPPAAAPVPPPRVAAPAPRPSSRRRILLLSLFAMGLVLLLVVVVLRKGAKKEIAAGAVPAPQTTTVAPAPVVAPPPVAVASATELLGSLQYDRALEAWEKQLTAADDPAIRARYADLALEIGRIHAANQSPDARAYFERAVKWGPTTGSESVAEAKRRLGS